MCFDGIYVSLSFNSGEFLLEQVEEILVDSTTGKEECVNIFTEQAINIKMVNVAAIDFKNKNITFNGCETIRKNVELPIGCKPALPAEIKKIDNKKEEPKQETPPKSQKEPAAKPAIWANFKIPSPRN